MSDKLLKDARKCWRPKMPMLDDMCASCPFREGNNQAFGEIVGRLQAKLRPRGKRATPTNFEIGVARINIQRDCENRPDFACHQTVYDSRMKMKPASEHMQCRGAAEFFLNR